MSAWTVEGEMTIYRAAELKEGLAVALRGDGLLEVDLAGVTEIDAAGVQLLLLARRMANKRARALRLTPGPAVDDVADLLALRPRFEER